MTLTPGSCLAVYEVTAVTRSELEHAIRAACDVSGHGPSIDAAVLPAGWQKRAIAVRNDNTHANTAGSCDLA